MSDMPDEILEEKIEQYKERKHMKLDMTKCNANGTSLQGYIRASYQSMIKVFGEPNSKGDGCKTDVEWCGTIDGEDFTIYNWKNGPVYGGDPVKDITNWNIGGRKANVANSIRKYLMDNV